MEFVATGADDTEVDRWIREYAVARDRSEIVRWNNQMRELRISELPVESQLYLEDYIPPFVTTPWVHAKVPAHCTSAVSFVESSCAFCIVGGGRSPAKT